MAKKEEYAIPRPYTATGEFLQAARLKGDFTQKELADHLEYSSAQFISNFERGITAPPTNKLAKLLKMLRVPLDAFMKVYAIEEMAAQKARILAASKSK